MISTTVSLSGADLDPTVRDFIRVTNEAYAAYSGPGRPTPAERRDIAERVRAPWVVGGPVMHRTENHVVETPHGPVRVRLYDPTPGDTKPALIYIHGGGWVMFSLDTHDRIMREYAARAGVCVIGVDYALSPEARFPVALEQIVAVVRHVRTQADLFGVDGSRVAVGGDSAGGNMSLAAALMLRDAGEPGLIKALLLNYGAFAIELVAEDHERFGGDGYMLSSNEMAEFWSHYLGQPVDARNPLAVPAHADLHGLPPVFLTIPQCDVLTGQSLQLHQRLQAAGVPAQAELYKGASHSFLEAVSISALAQQAFADASAWLRETLSACQKV